MTQSPACPLLDPSLLLLLFIYFYLFLPTHRYYVFVIMFSLLCFFITIMIFSLDQKIQVTCHHRHEPRTMGPMTPTGRRPPQSGTPCRVQHLRRRAPPQGDREERTGTAGTPAATPPNQGGRKETTGAVGTPAAAPPNQVGREGKIGSICSLAAAPPKQAVREDKTGAADAPATAGLGAERRKATGAETTNAANEPGTPHGSTPVAAAAHAADVNTPPWTTHKPKGVGPVKTTKGTGLHGSRRAPTEVTEREGRMTLGAVPAAEGASPATSGATNAPHNARWTLRGHSNGTDAPTHSRTASGRKVNVPASATPCT